MTTPSQAAIEAAETEIARYEARYCTPFVKGEAIQSAIDLALAEAQRDTEILDYVDRNIDKLFTNIAPCVGRYFTFDSKQSVGFAPKTLRAAALAAMSSDTAQKP